jgi:tripartite-type tricarboxylate transporter receptor subunit TctC
MKRRQFLRLAAYAAALPVVPRSAWAQSYPARPVTLVVFVGAGGAPDILARLLGERLSPRLGQTVVIENRPGGSGDLAVQAVARAPADGYTLLLVGTPHVVNATLHLAAGANLARDIAPVAGLARNAFVMIVNPSFPARTLAEFIAHANANPGRINMASTGTGNLSHLSGELFKMMTGVDMLHVPYRSAGAATTDLIAGNVQVMFDAVPSALPNIQAGTLRALAVTSTARLEALPDVATVAERVPGYEVSGFLGIGAPKNTPAEIIERLNGEINAALAEPSLTARLAGFGTSALTGSPGDFGSLVAAETEKWAKVTQFAGMRAL